MERSTIESRVASFSQWHYEFDLDGVRTPINRERDRNRHHERARYFHDQLVAVCGGSLAGKRVVDLGCNAGFWSLKAIEAGCDFVLGVDGRQMHIDQAELVFEVKEVDRARYEFQCANLFDFDFSAYPPFDVVLCLGLLYHVAKPTELFELMSSMNSDLLVVDTTLSLAQGSWIELHKDALDEPRNAVDYSLVFFPSRRAVLDIARQFGYEAVVLRPKPLSWDGMDDYRIGSRRAFLCSKKTDVRAVPADGEDPDVTTSQRAGKAVEQLGSTAGALYRGARYRLRGR